MLNLKDLKVALVVEELTQLGGAERILDVLLEIFPKAPVYTLVWDKVKTNHQYDRLDIRPSFIQKLPLGIKKYKWYLPLMPKAIESFDLDGFEVIISITSALVKGIKTNKNQLHICYCNTPTRYLWIDSDSYVQNAPIPFFVRPFMPLVLNYLRAWDLKASKRPDYFIANSKNVQQRIKKYYHRDSIIIYPMIDTNKYHLSAKIENYYLLVSRLEPYKRVDLVIDAFRKTKENLKIVGEGSKLLETKNKAPKNVELLGRQSDKNLADLYSHAKAVIFPQEEDFGIVPIESMASGRPVIAYKKGGALETVIENETGRFFFPQTVNSLKLVLNNFKIEKFNSQKIKQHAKKFDKSLFKKQLLAYIKDKLREKRI